MSGSYYNTMVTRQQNVT